MKKREVIEQIDCKTLTEQMEVVRKALKEFRGVMYEEFCKVFHLKQENKKAEKKMKEELGK